MIFLLYFYKMSRIKDEVYVPVSPDERRRIIERINCNQLSSGRARGRNRDIFHWTNKHHPEKPIPTDLYLLGSGTLSEQYSRYTKISETEFKNYRRELIYQGILVRR